MSAEKGLVEDALALLETAYGVLPKDRKPAADVVRARIEALESALTIATGERNRMTAKWEKARAERDRLREAIAELRGKWRRRSKDHEIKAHRPGASIDVTEWHSGFSEATDACEDELADLDGAAGGGQ